MKSVLVRLPDDLVSEAQAAGLLAEKSLADLLRRALRERSSRTHVQPHRSSRSLQLPVYRGRSGLAEGIDPLSNRSIADAAGDDT